MYITITLAATNRHAAEIGRVMQGDYIAVSLMERSTSPIFAKLRFLFFDFLPILTCQWSERRAEMRADQTKEGTFLLDFFLRLSSDSSSWRSPRKVQVLFAKLRPCGGDVHGSWPSMPSSSDSSSQLIARKSHTLV